MSKRVFDSVTKTKAVVWPSLLYVRIFLYTQIHPLNFYNQIDIAKETGRYWFFLFICGISTVLRFLKAYLKNLGYRASTRT
ncbi:hypothetical protein LEP1GSC190_04500 [Leptospira mayottensis 200901116]|nr:hypothetical protein LEP1GSC190_04500 [Leptospira mayottensis 200901116]